MTFSINLLQAKLRLAKLNRQRNSLIGQSLTLHGKWAVTLKSNNRPAQAKAHKAWADCINQIHQIEAQINSLSEYVNNGATVASLDLAKSVAVFEGGVGKDGLFHPYQDVVGVWTIGYGHTAADGDPVPRAATQPLTRAEATTLLLHDLTTFYVPQLRKYLKAYKWKVNQKMFDALVSFEYNLGPNYFAASHDIGHAMSRRDAHGTADAMLLYDKAGGRALPGLVRRRQWERQLFLGGHYSV